MRFTWTITIAALLGCGNDDTVDLAAASSTSSSGSETTLASDGSTTEATCGCQTATSDDEPVTTGADNSTTGAAPDRVIFVTSIEYNAGELQSLYLADAICLNRADDAGLADPLGFRAWLSDSTVDARDRFPRTGDERLVLVDGRVVAASWRALLSGHLQNPITLNERGEVYEGRVWTGTMPDGTRAPGNCDDWASDSFLKTGHYGYSHKRTSEWTMSESDDNPTPCPSNNAIYCIYRR